MTREEYEALKSRWGIKGTTGTTTPAATTTTSTPTTPVSATPAATSAASAAKDPWATLADIDKMSGAERLYSGLKFAYDQNVDQLEKKGRRDKSEIYRNGLSRGMQRSSFINQTAANSDTQNNEELSKLGQSFASQFASGLTDLENQEWQKAFQQQQFDWQKQNADRELAASYVSAILSAGGTPSADLLARAGISDADYASMKPAAAAASGGGGGSYKPKPTTNTNVNQNPNDQDLDAELDRYSNGSGSGGSNWLSGITNAISNVGAALQKGFSNAQSYAQKKKNS